MRYRIETIILSILRGYEFNKFKNILLVIYTYISSRDRQAVPINIVQFNLVDASI